MRGLLILARYLVASVEGGVDWRGVCGCYEWMDTRGMFWGLQPVLLEVRRLIVLGRSPELHKGVEALQLGLLGKWPMGS